MKLAAWAFAGAGVPEGNTIHNGRAIIRPSPSSRAPT